MFLQSNAQHIPRVQGKRLDKKRRGAGRHKGLSYFLYHLLTNTFTAIPFHHVKHCKQANDNSFTKASQRAEQNVLSAASWRGKKHYCLFK